MAEGPKHGGTRKGAGRPPNPGRKDGNTRIELRVLNQARVVARVRGIPLADYLSDLLRPQVARDFKDVVKVLDEGQNQT